MLFSKTKDKQEKKFVPVSERRTLVFVIDAVDYLDLVKKLNQEHASITKISAWYDAGYITNKLTVEVQDFMSLI